MTFSLGIFLEGVRDINGAITQILPMHIIYCGIGRFKAGETHKSKTLGNSCVWIPHNLRGNNNSKGSKRIIKKFFINFRIQVSNKQICTNIHGSLSACLVNANRTRKKLDHVHDLDSIVSIFFTVKLNEPVSSVSRCKLISWNMNIHYWARLKHEFPKESFVDLRVKFPHIDCCLLVSLLSLCHRLPSPRPEEEKRR